MTHKLESYLGIAKQFEMELRWFSRVDFFDRVAEIWNKSVLGQNSVQRWNRKMGAYENTSGVGQPIPMESTNNTKNHLESTISSLDIAAESRVLSDGECKQL